MSNETKTVVSRLLDAASIGAVLVASWHAVQYMIEGHYREGSFLALALVLLLVRLLRHEY